MCRDGITYESEVANAAPKVTKVVVDLVKQIAFAELMKRLKCFALGTQVVVAQSAEPGGPVRYQTVAIETLKRGDLVLAREEYGSQVRLQRIEETFVRISDHLRVLTFTDASGRTQTIKTTDEHPFWIAAQNRYILAGELPSGSIVTGPNGEQQTLTTTRREIHLTGTPVYNFSVTEYHTYFVAERVDDTPLLVHNASYSEKASENVKSRTRNGKTEYEYVDPKTGKKKWGTLDQLAGDHRFPRQALKEAKANWLKKNKGKKLSPEAEKELEDLINAEQNLKLMPRRHNSAKGQRTADDYAETPLGQEASGRYIDQVRRAQKRTAQRIAEILGRDNLPKKFQDLLD